MLYDHKERVLHGPEFLQSVPTGSYGRTVLKHLKQNYDLPVALVDCITRKTVSYKALLEESLRLADGLRSSGVTQSDVIAISSENSVYYPIALIASLWVGATVTLFNPLYTLREVLHVSNISKPSIILCSNTSLQLILQAQKELPSIKKIITIDGDCNVEGVERMANIVARHSGNFRRFEPVEDDSHSVAFILYSSGTTGLPKGVMLTHSNFHTAFLYFSDERYFVQNAPGTSSNICIMPFFHAYGLHVLLSGLMHGDMVLVLPKFETHSYLKTIQDFKVKHLYIVPSIAKYLIYSESVDGYDLAHIDSMTCGAAPLSKSTQELILNKFKKVTHIRQGYGLTEATLAVVITPTASPRLGSVGKILPQILLKVVDVDTGKSLGPGENGEICAKGPALMKGYAGDTSSTDDLIDKDGWLHTGDLGYYDTDGFLYVIDRLKELIKYKGFQVPPAELEGILLGHPKISDAAVIGVPDNRAGEVPLAYVVKIPHEALTEDEVKNYVAERVTSSKFLRGGVRFVEEIPKNSTGKILRRELRQLVSYKSKL